MKGQNYVEAGDEGLFKVPFKVVGRLSAMHWRLTLLVVQRHTKPQSFSQAKIILYQK